MTTLDKKITLGRLSHFAERYTSEVLNPALNTYSEAFAHNLSLENNILTLENSTGVSLASITLPSACRFNVEIVSELPENPDPDTLYFIQSNSSGSGSGSGSGSESGSNSNQSSPYYLTPTLVIPQEVAGTVPYSSSLALLPNGEYVAAFPTLNGIKIFNSNGSIKIEYGSRGVDPGQFITPSALCIDPDNGNIYVGCADIANTSPNYITELSYNGTDITYITRRAVNSDQIRDIVYNSTRNSLIVAASNINDSYGSVVQLPKDLSGYGTALVARANRISSSNVDMSPDGTILLVMSHNGNYYNKKMVYDSAYSTSATTVEDLSICQEFPTPQRFRYSDDGTFIVFSDTTTSRLYKVDLNTEELTILDSDAPNVQHIINNGNNRFTYVCYVSSSQSRFKRIDL